MRTSAGPHPNIGQRYGVDLCYGITPHVWRIGRDAAHKRELGVWRPYGEEAGLQGGDVVQPPMSLSSTR